MSSDLVSRVKKRVRDRSTSEPHVGVVRSVGETNQALPVGGQLSAGISRAVDLIETQRQAADPLGDAPVSTDMLSTLRRNHGRGQVLPGAVASTMERELGRDLSGVRLHTDGEADKLARSVQSEAFTHGSDIYFSGAKFKPGTSHGDHLLAHELAHVAQRSTGGGPVIGRADDPAEADADRVADRIAPALSRSMATPRSDQRPGTASSGPAASDGPLQRKITKSGRDIEALRSSKSQKKGVRTNDTLFRIGKLVDKHAQLDDPEKIIASLGLITGLCQHWLEKHKKTSQSQMVGLVEDILAEAHRDYGVARAQRRYVNDARAGVKPIKGTGRKGPEHKATSHALGMGITDSAVTGGKTAVANKTDQLNPDRHHAFIAESYLIKMAGLTEAEVVAIKKFSGGDYVYINPAMESKIVPERPKIRGKTVEGPMGPNWMRNQMDAIQSGLTTGDFYSGEKRTADYDKLVEEGSLHAGVAMQGLSKLKPMQGQVFRGERMSQEEFDRMYGRNPTTTFNSFKSMTTVRGTAERYSINGVIGNTIKPNQTLSVLSIFEVHDARDIKSLSEVKAENEWVVLPGSSFDVNRIDDVPNGQAANPAVTPISEWKIVRLKQKRKAPAAKQA